MNPRIDKCKYEKASTLTQENQTWFFVVRVGPKT